MAPVGDGSFGDYDTRRRHDGKDSDPAHAPGPVRRLDPVTLQPLDDVGRRRVDVGAQERKRQRSNLIQRARTMPWSKQAERIERTNAILLERVARAIEDGSTDPETISALARCAQIAKSFLVEQRADGAAKDPASMSDEELERAARSK